MIDPWAEALLTRHGRYEGSSVGSRVEQLLCQESRGRHGTAVSDVLVNGCDEIWVERNGILEQSTVSFPDSDAIVAAVDRVIAPLGLRIDRASPAVDAR